MRRDKAVLMGAAGGGDKALALLASFSMCGFSFAFSAEEALL